MECASNSGEVVSLCIADSTHVSKLSHSKILRHRRGKLSFSCASFLADAKVLQNSSHTPTMSTSMGKVHVDSLRLFEAACERAPIDIISFECTQRPTFRISRKLVNLFVIFMLPLDIFCLTTIAWGVTDRVGLGSGHYF